MTTPRHSHHDHLRAVVLAEGKSTMQLIAMACADPDSTTRRIAGIALGIRHPIYAGRSFEAAGL